MEFQIKELLKNYDIDKIKLDLYNKIHNNYDIIISKFMIMLFSNMYYINNPSNLIKCGKYSEFQRQENNKVSEASCNLDKFIKSPNSNSCNKSEILKFNELKDGKCNNILFDKYMDYDIFYSDVFIEKLNKTIDLFMINNIIEYVKNINQNDVCILIDIENIEKTSDKSIKDVLDVYTKLIEPNKNIYIFGIKKYNTKSENININFGIKKINYKFINLNITPKQQENGEYEKDDIDDVFLLFMYAYIRFAKNTKCYLWSNDNYIWTSLPMYYINDIILGNLNVSITKPTSIFLYKIYLLLNINFKAEFNYDKNKFSNFNLDNFNYLVKYIYNHINYDPDANKENELENEPTKKKSRKERGGYIYKYYKYLIKNKQIKK